MNRAIYHLPQLFTGCLILFLAVFVYNKNRKSNLHAMFLAFAVPIFFWQIFYFVSYIFNDVIIAYWILRVGYSFVLFIPPVTYHFSSIWGEMKSEMKYVYLSYALSTLFLCFLWFSDLFMAPVLNSYSWGHYPRAGLLHPLFMAYLILLIIRMNSQLYMRYKRSMGKEDKGIRLKAQYAFFSLFVFSIAVCDFIPNYQVNLYPMGFLFVGLYCALMAYGIIRHQLLDIRIVIKKTMFYSMSLFFVSGFYVVLVFVIHKLMLAQRIGQAGLMSSVLLIFVISLTLKPVENLVRRFLDNRFFHGTIFEISEQKEKLETELERQERLKSVGILAAGMAHEIKNPLTAIQTFTEYLPEKYQDPEYRAKFQSIVTQEVTKIKNIVGDLLLFSRPSEPVPVSFNPGQILKDLLDLLSNDLLRYNIRVMQNLQSLPSSTTAYADPGQIKQAFLNILLNAIDAMKEKGGELRVSVERSYPSESDVIPAKAGIKPSHDSRLCGNDAVSVTISDTGCGIELDKLKHIFDPFYTDKEHGTGLGLAVTHSIIQKNKGAIQVQSQPGKGTGFTVVLPLKG